MGFTSGVPGRSRTEATLRSSGGQSGPDPPILETSEFCLRFARSHAIIPAGDVLMCLAAPARVISVSDKTAVVDYQGVRTTARLDTLAEPVAIGDYILVHTGFAIQRLTAEDAEETLRLFDELAQSVAAEESQGRRGSERPDQVTRSATSQDRPAEQGSARLSQVTRSATTGGPPAEQGDRGR